MGEGVGESDSGEKGCAAVQEDGLEEAGASKLGEGVGSFVEEFVGFCQGRLEFVCTEALGLFVGS